MTSAQAMILAAAMMILAAAMTIPGNGPERVSREGPEKGLYSDSQVEKFVGDGLDELKEKGRIVLDVLPKDKTSYPRGEVFKMLRIDEKRLRDRRSTGIFMVMFLEWQISPSYDISFMSACNDPANEGLPPFDLKRKVYGIRIVNARNRTSEHSGKSAHQSINVQATEFKGQG